MNQKIESLNYPATSAVGSRMTRFCAHTHRVQKPQISPHPPAQSETQDYIHQATSQADSHGLESGLSALCRYYLLASPKCQNCRCGLSYRQ